MKKDQFDQIMKDMPSWILSEGLCRFCDSGRVCDYSRRGTEICPIDEYQYTAEKDCFHLWIKKFDTEFSHLYFREGYDYRDDHPYFHPELKEQYPEKTYLFHPKLNEIGKEGKFPSEVFSLEFYNFLMNVNLKPREGKTSTRSSLTTLKEYYNEFFKPLEGLMFIEVLAFLRNTDYVTIHERENIVELHFEKLCDLTRIIKEKIWPNKK